mgnify:FL=1
MREDLDVFLMAICRSSLKRFENLAGCLTVEEIEYVYDKVPGFAQRILNQQLWIERDTNFRALFKED